MDAHPRSTPVINSPDPDQPRYLFPPSLFSPAFSFTFFFFPSSLQAFFGQGQLSLAAALLTISFVRPNCPPPTLNLPTDESPSPYLSSELASRGLNLSFFSQPFRQRSLLRTHTVISLRPKTSLTFPRFHLDKSHEVFQALLRVPRCCTTLRRPFRPGVEWSCSPSSKSAPIHPTIPLLISACSLEQ